MNYMECFPEDILSEKVQVVKQLITQPYFYLPPQNYTVLHVHRCAGAWEEGQAGCAPGDHSAKGRETDLRSRRTYLYCLEFLL